MQPGNEKYLSDFAMILVNDDSKTGWFGTQWDWQGAYKNATKIGYPVGIADGEVIQVLPGPISVSDGIVELRHGDPNEQGGSSAAAPGSATTTPRAIPSATTSSASSCSASTESPASTTARISTPREEALRLCEQRLQVGAIREAGVTGLATKHDGAASARSVSQLHRRAPAAPSDLRTNATRG